MHNTASPNAHIQLVDDDPVVTATLKDGLGAAGYTIAVNHDAGSALAAYRSQPPDLAIVDIGLPDMPGTDLAAAMLRHLYRPILILSSHSDGPRVRKAIDSGVVGYLVKPLSAQQLVPSIETTLARFADIGAEVVKRLGESTSRGVKL
jgi:DNA-binding response OmpR family regulator